MSTCPAAMSPMRHVRLGLLLLLAACARATAKNLSPAAASTLRDHPITSGPGGPVYLDGCDWNATRSTAGTAGLAIAATVPGDILTDLQRAGQIPDPYFNSSWAEPSFVAAWNTGTWTYAKSFPSPAHIDAAAKGGALLVFEGVRMGAMILLNGELLGNATDQFLRYEFSVGRLLRPAAELNELRVVFGAELGINCEGRWTRSNEIDWAPNMPTKDRFVGRSTFGFGIWKSVYLLPVPARTAAITQLVPHTFYAGGHPTTMLRDANHSGFVVNVTVRLWAPAATAGTVSVLGSWPGATPVSASADAVVGASSVTVTIPAAQTKGARLWQPHGHGEQIRYNLSATFAAGAGPPATAWRQIGFRHIALVTVNDSDAAVATAASSQDGTGTFTMFFRVNGAPVYARGGNKIPMELLDGRMTARAHWRLVKSAAEGNFNMLRIWGGAIFEPRAFYDAADEFGIMLYHDMQFAGGSATSTPLVRQELEYQIQRLSHHPSIAMWDGCNECGGGGDYMNFIMPVVSAIDASRPIWPSCPAPGWITGVDRLSSRPNGKKLITGPGGIDQIVGEARPSGYPFVQEAHGPYTAFMGMNMAETVMPRNHPPSLLGETNEPALVPANLGAGEEGWYRSEFGCVSWSSFESMTSQMPPDQWSMLNAAGQVRCGRNWNPSNVITKFFGTGAANGMRDIGSTPFKRQLYQSMVGQLLFLKTEIEAWRSTNLWGSTFWMYNEIWPTGGWGSIEYGSAVPGQLEGGRWKPLHYALKSSTFADQMSTCNTAGACLIKNDSPFPFKGRWTVRLINVITGASSHLTQKAVALPAGPAVAQWHCASNSTVTVASATMGRLPATHNYSLHVGQIPVNRGNYTKGSPLVGASIAKCEQACDADAACVGFTRSPPNELSGSCWMYEVPKKLFDYPSADWYQKMGTAPLPAPPPPPPRPSPPPPCKPGPTPLQCLPWSQTAAWKMVGCDTNGTNCVLVIEVTSSSGVQSSLNMLPFLPPKDMTVPAATVTATVKLTDNIPTVALTTNATALWVVLTTAAIGRFSDNAFLLEKSAAPREIIFNHWDDAPDAAKIAMAELQSTLRVEHLSQMLIKPSPPPPPPPPLQPCPATGCAGCVGIPPCHWPFDKATCPSPSLPFTAMVQNTTAGCEELCTAQGEACVGFTMNDIAPGGSVADCYFYSHVSGLFSHDRQDVTWHPKPQLLHLA